MENNSEINQKLYNKGRKILKVKPHIHFKVYGTQLNF